MWLMLGWRDTTQDNVSVVQLYRQVPDGVKDVSKPGNARVSVNIETCSCNHFCRRKEVLRVTYCVSVSLVIQHAKRM
jgi:hypothetical protein